MRRAPFFYLLLAQRDRAPSFELLRWRIKFLGAGRRWLNAAGPEACGHMSAG
jgi:hypothetical protein